MADWWNGGGESAGPSEAELRAAGFQFTGGGEGGSWQAPAEWVRTSGSPLGYSPAPAEAPEVGWRPSVEHLKVLAETPAQTISRYVETGEGGYTTYDYYDPARQAKTILAQPEKVTPEYIKKNFTGFDRLPAATLQAMANDWRNAYAQLMKISTPEKLPEGYAQAVSRIEGGKPFISFGGPTEIFQEAAPYVTYDPNYGLVVPQQGIQPDREKFGIMNLAPIVLGGLALGPLAGALGGGALGAAGAGALTGGVTSALTGGDVLKGALTGGVTAGLGAAASPVVGEALKSAGIVGPAADVLKNAAVSAGTAAMRGGDPLQAAVSAAVGTGVGGAVSGLDLLKDLDPAIAKAVTAAASGAAKAAVTGGDPVMSALMGVADTGLNTAINALSPATSKGGAEAKPETPGPTDFEYGEAPIFDIIDPEKIAATPTEKWIDQGFLVNEATPSIESLLAELGQQEEDRAAMQSSVLGYDPRITEALQDRDAERAGMETALSQTGAAVAAKPVGVATSGAPKATAQQSAAQPTATAQSAGMDMGALLALLGLAQQQTKAPPPVELAGEIKPYEFSSDLLAGVYGKPRSNIYSANEDLLNMTRGS